MQKTNQKTLEEIIRVDHAGERGAIKIYEGQLLALKTIVQNSALKNQIEEMKEQEKEHLEYFEKEIQRRKIKPTSLLPLWDILGISLGRTSNNNTIKIKTISEKEISSIRLTKTKAFRH